MLFMMSIENTEVRSEFDKLCRLHRDDIYWYALSRVKNPYVADDITQDTFFRAYTTYVKNKERECIITKSLLVTIAKNKCYDYFNEQKNNRKRTIHDKSIEEFYGLTDVNALIEKQIISKENAITVHKVLEQMHEPYADILRFIYFDELEYDEIAELMGIEINNAYQKYYRALAAFKKIAEERSDLCE